MSSKLVQIKDNIAIYRVHYETGLGEKQKITFSIERKDDGSFYVEKLEHVIPADYSKK